MTREQIIAAIRKATKKLGRVPTVQELVSSTRITRRAIQKFFGTYAGAWRACGLERYGPGYKVELQDLFLDWAGVARALGKVPTIAEYNKSSKYSCRPLVTHYGGWSHVPSGLLAYARKAGLDDQWKDVLEIVAACPRGPQGQIRRSGKNLVRTKPRIVPDKPVYGPPMFPAPLTYAPTNEAGVLFLFGAVAREKGFAVARLQAGFPDCEALREIEPERWQPVRIEFEYESRNFLAHQHSVSKCDLIVCWRHNWPGCPLEVLELKSAIKQTLPEEHG